MGGNACGSPYHGGASRRSPGVHMKHLEPPTFEQLHLDGCTAAGCVHGSAPALSGLPAFRTPKHCPQLEVEACLVHGRLFRRQVILQPRSYAAVCLYLVLLSHFGIDTVLPLLSGYISHDCPASSVPKLCAADRGLRAGLCQRLCLQLARPSQKRCELVSGMTFSCDQAVLELTCLHMPQAFLDIPCLPSSGLVLVAMPGLHGCTFAYAGSMAILADICASRGNALWHSSASSLQFPSSVMPPLWHLEDWTLVH